MRERKKNSIDQWIEDAIREEIHNSPSPQPPSEAWEQINLRLKGEGKRRPQNLPFLRKKIIYAASCIMVIVGVLAWTPQSCNRQVLLNIFC